MNREKLIPILIIVVIVVGTYFYFNKPTQDINNAEITPTNDSANNTNATSTQTTASTTSKTYGLPIKNGEYQVVYNGKTFTPSLLSITAGKAVAFVNQSDKAMSVVSNPYPLNSDFSILNQEHVLARGGVYHFTFTKAGTYGYHDSFNPTAKGTIVVK